MKRAIRNKPVDHRYEDLQVGIKVCLKVNGANKEGVYAAEDTVSVSPNQEISRASHQGSFLLGQVVQPPLGKVGKIALSTSDNIEPLPT